MENRKKCRRNGPIIKAKSKNNNSKQQRRLLELSMDELKPALGCNPLLTYLTSPLPFSTCSKCCRCRCRCRCRHRRRCLCCRLFLCFLFLFGCHWCPAVMGRDLLLLLMSWRQHTHTHIHKKTLAEIRAKVERSHRHLWFWFWFWVSWQTKYLRSRHGPGRGQNCNTATGSSASYFGPQWQSRHFSQRNTHAAHTQTQTWTSRWQSKGCNCNNSESNWCAPQ